MLILTRRISESLVVGDQEIVFTVLGIKGNQVRIGIKADKNLPVDREEIYLRKKENNNMDINRPAGFKVDTLSMARKL